MDAQTNQAAILHQAALDDAARAALRRCCRRRPGPPCACPPATTCGVAEAAASAGAPAPSASVFSRSSSVRIAEAISSSFDCDDLVDVALHDGECDLARATHCDAVGDRRRRLERHRMMLRATASFIDGSRAVCTPMTRTSGFDSFMAHATPPMSPPPPIGTTTASRFSNLLQQFESDRSLASHHQRVVEGMDEGHALGSAQRRVASSQASS